MPPRRKETILHWTTHGQTQADNPGHHRCSLCRPLEAKDVFTMRHLGFEATFRHNFRSV